MWGQTIDDFITMKERPWRLWHVFGFFDGKDNVRPWNLLDEIMLIFAHEDERAHFISDDFSAEYLWDLVVVLVPFTFAFTLLYISTLLSCLLVAIVWMGIPATTGDSVMRQ
jgi:hypothetical protein